MRRQTWPPGKGGRIMLGGEEHVVLSSHDFTITVAPVAGTRKYKGRHRA